MNGRVFGGAAELLNLIAGQHQLADQIHQMVKQLDINPHCRVGQR